MRVGPVHRFGERVTGGIVRRDSVHEPLGIGPDQLDELRERFRPLALRQDQLVVRQDQRVGREAIQALERLAPGGSLCTLYSLYGLQLTLVHEAQPTRRRRGDDEISAMPSGGAFRVVALECFLRTEIESLDDDPGIFAVERLDDSVPVLGAHVAVDFQSRFGPGLCDERVQAGSRRRTGRCRRGDDESDGKRQLPYESQSGNRWA